MSALGNGPSPRRLGRAVLILGLILGGALGAYAIAAAARRSPTCRIAESYVRHELHLEPLVGEIRDVRSSPWVPLAGPGPGVAGVRLHATGSKGEARVDLLLVADGGGWRVREHRISHVENW